MNEFTIDLTKEGIKKLHYISVDPEIKLLKEINSIKFEDNIDGISQSDILKNQLLNGETIIEKIEAIRYFKKIPSESFINPLRDAILDNNYYGISVEAANTLGAFSKARNDKDEKIKKGAYETLKSFFEEKSDGQVPFSGLDARIKTAVISAISSYNTKESMDNIIQPLVSDENPYVAGQAILAIGTITSQLAKDKKITLKQEKEKIDLLKSICKGEFGPDHFHLEI